MLLYKCKLTWSKFCKCVSYTASRKTIVTNHDIKGWSAAAEPSLWKFLIGWECRECALHSSSWARSRQWADICANDGQGSVCFPLKHWESGVKRKNMTLEGCVLDLLFCLSTRLCCSLVCFPCCRETKSSRQFHHHHAGACPADVQSDLLQEDREFSMQLPISVFRKIASYLTKTRGLPTRSATISCFFNVHYSPTLLA